MVSSGKRNQDEIPYRFKVNKSRIFLLAHTNFNVCNLFHNSSEHTLQGIQIIFQPQLFESVHLVFRLWAHEK